MSVNKYKALELATQIVTAAAQAGSLKLEGVPTGNASAAVSSAEKDGAYIATLLNTISDKIKTV
ncbi:hypothetical protein [Caballeronia glebae]|uniref:hypothetical protein n=1 Tax=Caballeronia glebae TaxID=1777143 RepID=UPI0038BB4585